MTRDEILAMPAGREMDALVAERVLGCKVIRDERVSFTGEAYTAFMCGCTAGKHGTGTCAVSSGYSLHEYSTRISYAWEVVGKLMEGRKYGAFVADGYDAGAAWLAGFGHNSALADTAPLAICRAALLTEGK